MVWSGFDFSKFLGFCPFFLEHIWNSMIVFCSPLIDASFVACIQLVLVLQGRVFSPRSLQEKPQSKSE